MVNEGLNVGLAFLAGIASFVSPCVLPLIPAYISLMGGTSLQGLSEQSSLRRVAIVNTLFFIAGFSALFIALGVLFSTTLGLLSGLTKVIDLIAGAVVVLLGLNFIFDFVGFLNFEHRFQLRERPSSRVGSLLFGMAFGAGWSPCVGPILGSILLLAGTSRSVLQGGALLLVYSLGLGLPFLLTGIFFAQALKQFARMRRHIGAIKIGSGLFLVLIGLLILIGELRGLNGFLFGLSRSLAAWQAQRPLTAHLVFGAVLATPALLIALFSGLRARHACVERHSAATFDGGPPISTRAALLQPVPILFFVLFSVAAALSFAGMLDLPGLVAVWLGFQGL